VVLVSQFASTLYDVDVWSLYWWLQCSMGGSLEPRRWKCHTD
jgi:hypothetical protein